MKIEIQSITERRCRAGRCFTRTPEFFDEGDFTAEQWKLLEDDTMLSMRRVSDEEAEEVADDDVGDAALIEAAIRDLDAAGFSASTGHPKVGSVNAALKAGGIDLVVNGAAIDPVFASMEETGFKAPEASA